MTNLGDFSHAQLLCEQSMSLFRELGDLRGVAYCLNNLGYTALLQGNDPDQVIVLCTESRDLFAELGDTVGIVSGLQTLAWVEAAQRRWVHAVRLLGAAHALQTAGGYRHRPAEQSRYAELLAGIRAHLDAGTWAAEWAGRQIVPLNQIVNAALEADSFQISV